MDSPEKGSISPTERITRAWQNMCRTGQIRFYMASSSEEIEDLKVGKREINDQNKYIVEYLEAIKELTKNLVSRGAAS